MNILLIHDGIIASDTYDDAVRILCGLAQNLTRRGHQVTFLVPKGSVCAFAPVVIREPKLPLEQQIPAGTEVLHFHSEPPASLALPYLFTFHGKAREPRSFPANTVFVSAHQAAEHGGSVYVHYGLDFEAYGTPLLDMRRTWLHFTSSAQWGHHNLRGAMELAAQAGTRLHVLGDSRFSLRERRLTLSPSVRFHGRLHAGGRDALLNGSRGLVFPVVWPEPFGLAIIESLYFGCPVFGTPYGALPELLGRDTKPRKVSTGGGQVDAFYADFGCLSVKKSELLEAIKNADSYDRSKCNAWVREHFSAENMTDRYIRLYEQVLDGRPLHHSPPAFTEAANDKPLPFGG